MRPVVSTVSLNVTRRGLLAGTGALLLSGCVAGRVPMRFAPPPTVTDGAFVMPDGARLPYRAWLPVDVPEDGPWAVVLALHGFNDSRDAWEVPAPDFTAAGIGVFAPDQRGFGAAPGRGRWVGAPVLVGDAAAMVRRLRARFPRSRVFVMGESMGGALAMLLATSRQAPPVDGYVLVAPAVWGRADMGLLLRGALFVAVHTVPGLALSGAAAKVVASDNYRALLRLSTDPLTLHRTRMDTLEGLVELMDAALAASAHFRAPALFLYGGKDELVPQRATRDAWRRLEGAGDVGARVAFYPGDYHLMLRDKGRATPIGDVLGWMRAPAAPLPSGAEAAAKAWLFRPG